MARPLRIEYPGGVYHITSRGNVSIYYAHLRYGYTLKEIADYLRIHYTTASKIIKEVEGRG